VGAGIVPARRSFGGDAEARAFVSPNTAAGFDGMKSLGRFRSFGISSWLQGGIKGNKWGAWGCQRGGLARSAFSKSGMVRLK